jgi:hypothetical protein
MSYEIKTRYFIRIPNQNMLGDHYEYEFQGDEDLHAWLGECTMRMHRYMRISQSPKVEMIKHCRNMRGWGLAEAKAFVEEFFPWLTAAWRIDLMRDV